MVMINILRHGLIRYSLQEHGSSMGWRYAGKYTKYLKYCRKVSPLQQSDHQSIRLASEEFLLKGVIALQTPKIISAGQAFAANIRDLEKKNNIWSGGTGTNVRQFQGDVIKEFPEVLEILKGDVREFLASVYGCPYKIFYTKFLKSLNERDDAIGSQLWHSDAGPGTCINALFFPEGVSKENGAIEVLPMHESRELFLDELVSRRKRQGKGEIALKNKEEIREFKTQYYAEKIDQCLAGKLVQPVSREPLFVFFRNNSIHKGGFPQKGLERLALMFHFYPSSKEPNFEQYSRDGLMKTAPYPKEPDFGE